MYNILVCDDEKDIVSALTIYLTTSGYQVFSAYDGTEALALLEKEDIHLVLLDIMMPQLDGIATMTRLREKSNVPVILLTAKSEDTDKILGLNVGADDYVTKPFNPVEVLARVKSQLRRYLQLGGGTVRPTALRLGGVALDDRTKEVTLDGEPVSLTPREYEILRLLMQNPGTVFSPKRIYRTVWGEEPFGVENAVAVHIRHLREKLEINPSDPRYIKVVWVQAGRGQTMKKYRTKPWAKGLACGLFVLAMTVSVICLGNVRWLAYHGGYQWEGTRQLVEEEEAVWVENLTNQLADGYRAYRDGDQSLDVKRYVEDENFFFTIKDLEGNTLLASDTLGDYREKTSWSMQVGGTVQWSRIDQYYDSYEARDLALDQLDSTYEELRNVSLAEDEEGYRLTADAARTVGSETVVLTGFLRSELSPTGQVYQGIQYAENMGFYRYEFLAGAILGLVLGLLSLGFLLWSAGLRQEGSEEVSLRWMDRTIPTDLLIVAGAAVLLFGFLPVACSSGWGASLVAFGPTVLTMALMGVVLAMALSLVRRRRGGIGKENLFFPRLIRPVRRWGKALGRRTGELLGKLPLFWAAGLGFLLLCFLEGLCLMGCYYGGGWVVLWLLLKVLEGGLVLFVVLSMRTLQAGGRQLAAGHLDYKVSTEHLRGPFREHGENLNNIRQGIQHAVEEQMKSERMKTELITNVSHDIKTPLTSIVSYVDLLKKQAMPNDQAREYLEVLDRQSARLKKLTEDLVEASKASTGNLTVDFQRTDVNVLLTQSAGEYQEKLAAKGMDLILTPAPENPAISADGRLLWRVFENLLSNIHKYAQPGTRVYLTCEAGENQVTITFRNISATPLNISADELMERFVRGDASRNTEGSGLGLSIARSLTQLQHGTFSLTIDGDLFKAALTFPRIP